MTETANIKMAQTKYFVLDHGHVDLVDYMGSDLSVVNAARVSFNKESSWDYADSHVPIKTLPEKQRLVLSLYQYEDLNLKEIGQVLDVTESRVSQLHTQAILKLRGKLKSVFDSPEDLAG